MFTITGGALLLLVGLAMGQGRELSFHSITLRSALAVGYLAIFGSLLGMTAYTYILHAAPPSRVATYAYVNPVVAVFLGWLVAGEHITMQMLVAAAVIVFSVVLVITAPHAPVAEDVAAQTAPE
jgi:drug/metabolite transporter (DMT)-like permease